MATNHIFQLLQNLRSDLEMLGFGHLIEQIDKISELYKTEKKPVIKKKIAPKLKAKEIILNLEITENGKTTSVCLGEKKAEAYLKLRKKEHSKKVDAFTKSNGLTPPRYKYRDKDYALKCKEFENKIIAAGLSFSVKINKV